MSTEGLLEGLMDGPLEDLEEKSVGDALMESQEDRLGMPLD